MAETLAKMKLDVLNTKGETVGAVEIDPADFGGKINKQLLHDVVVMHVRADSLDGIEPHAVNQLEIARCE